MKNVLLRAMAFAVDKESEKFKDGADGITLSVNGTIISGIIVPRKTFLAQNQNTALNYFFELAETTFTDEEKAERESNLTFEDVNFLYLKNACYYNTGNPIPANRENYMCVQINSVDAYNMGFLGAN